MTNSIKNTQDGRAVSPLISVVMPVYNGKEHLAEAIDSILAQTYANFELIMIDDGSTDGSQQILRRYEKLDARVRVIVRENRGLATTLNDSIDIARGAWIARMDQDDIALPHRFERQLKCLERTGADIAGSWVRRFGSTDKRVVRLRQTDEAIKMEMLFESPFAHPAVMMRTTSVRTLGYDKVFEKAEDYDLWERAAESGWKMANEPEVLLMYRVHAAQISTKTAGLQQQQAHKICRRSWQFVSNSMQLNPHGVEQVLKLLELTLLEIDMDAVDALFTELLQRNSGEARDVIFDHMTRLYYRMAASCPNIVSRWSKLSRESGYGLGVGTRLRLSLFHWMRIRIDGASFKLLKKLYIWKASW